MPPKLRAVTPDEEPPKESGKVKKTSVVDAAKSGDARELFVAMRDRIAIAVENPNTPARDLAALTKRLAETVREIEAIDARDEEEAENAGQVADADFDINAV